MIRFLAIVFVLMALYGVMNGFVLAGILALLAAGLCVAAERRFARQDREWANDPANAREVKQDTLTELELYECECMRSKD